MSTVPSEPPSSSTPTDPASALAFSDTAIVPFSELLDTPFGASDHRGGPVWPRFDGQMPARHCRAGVPIDVEPAVEGPFAETIGPVAWGGPIVRHFGHQLADFSMRLPHTVDRRPDLPLAFATKPDYGIER